MLLEVGKVTHEAPLRLNDMPHCHLGGEGLGGVLVQEAPQPGLSLRLKGQWRKGESKQPTSSCCFSKPDVLPLWAS